MARFLFTFWPFRGHIHPAVPVASSLGAMGHETAFYTGTRIRSTLEAEGFRCFPFVRVDEGLLDRLVLAPDGIPGQALHPFRKKSMIKQWMLETVPAQLQDLDAILQEWGPDVIVTDPSMWAPFLVLREKLGLPVAVLCYTGACILPGRGVPPFGLGIPRLPGRLGMWLNGMIQAGFEWFTSDTPRAASQIRARHGLFPLKESVTRLSAGVPLYLVASAREFDYARNDLPSSVRYVGPCHWNRPRGAGAPRALEGLPAEKPLVFVTEGTAQNGRPLLLEAAWRGLRRTDLNVIMTTGMDRDPLGLGLDGKASNIHVERYVPLDDILGHVDVMVTTGGSGTVLASLAAGVPLVVVPMAWDQPENAWRVGSSGAGIRIPPRACTPGRLRRAVFRLLGNGRYRKNAERMSRILHTYGGPGEAARLLSDLSESNPG